MNHCQNYEQCDSSLYKSNQWDKNNLAAFSDGEWPLLFSSSWLLWVADWPLFVLLSVAVCFSTSSFFTVWRLWRESFLASCSFYGGNFSAPCAQNKLGCFARRLSWRSHKSWSSLLIYFRLYFSFTTVSVYFQTFSWNFCFFVYSFCPWLRNGRPVKLSINVTFFQLQFSWLFSPLLVVFWVPFDPGMLTGL